MRSPSAADDADLLTPGDMGFGRFVRGDAVKIGLDRRAAGQFVPQDREGPRVEEDV